MSYLERRMKKFLRRREELLSMDRETLVERIEGFTGSLKSVPWSKVSKEDMVKLLVTLQNLYRS